MRQLVRCQTYNSFRDIELKLHQARFVLYGVAEAYDDPARRGLITNEMAVAKHTVTNIAIDIVDKAMRVVGQKLAAIQSITTLLSQCSCRTS